MRAKFITGDADLDADWEEYINTLNRMGLEELFSIINQVWPMNRQ